MYCTIPKASFAEECIGAEDAVRKQDGDTDATGKAACRGAADDINAMFSAGASRRSKQCCGTHGHLLALTKAGRQSASEASRNTACRFCKGPISIESGRYAGRSLQTLVD